MAGTTVRASARDRGTATCCIRGQCEDNFDLVSVIIPWVPGPTATGVRPAIGSIRAPPVSPRFVFVVEPQPANHLGAPVRHDRCSVRVQPQEKAPFEHLRSLSGTSSPASCSGQLSTRQTALQPAGWMVARRQADWPSGVRIRPRGDM